eukprot:4408020-Prymnesium_polylepis.1
MQLPQGRRASERGAATRADDGAAPSRTKSSTDAWAGIGSGSLPEARSRQGELADGGGESLMTCVSCTTSA